MHVYFYCDLKTFGIDTKDYNGAPIAVPSKEFFFNR